MSAELNKTKLLRVRKLIYDTIKKFNLNLSELVVLTEAASGNYAYTPIIAALAGARVYAITRDSKYASAVEVIENTIKLAEYFNVRNKIQIFTEKRPEIISQADIVTNLGFVRPINKWFISHMKPTAVIPLMYETWEFRRDDIDLDECIKRGICVLGTNEEDNRLRIFDYLGLLCAKKLFECEIEIAYSKIVIIGSGKFGYYISKTLEDMNAEVIWFKDKKEICLDKLEGCDAIIVAEHVRDEVIIGDNGYISPNDLSKVCRDAIIINLSGVIDRQSLDRYGIKYLPKEPVKARYMAWSLSELGPKPVIDLHTAGLKVGEIMARLRLKGLSPSETIREALKNPLCQGWGEKHD